MSAAEIPGQCGTCRHFHDQYAPPPPGTDPRTTDVGELKCDAFRDGIPWPIQLGDFDHTRPYPGDHGIQSERTDPIECPGGVWEYANGDLEVPARTESDDGSIIGDGMVRLAKRTPEWQERRDYSEAEKKAT